MSLRYRIKKSRPGRVLVLQWLPVPIPAGWVKVFAGRSMAAAHRYISDHVNLQEAKDDTRKA